MVENRNNRTQAEKMSGKTDFPIMELLPVGRENAVSADGLAKLLGCKNTRELRLMVANERNRGAVICSSASGYYKAKNRAEIAEYCHSMESMATSIFQATRGAKKALELPEGQEELFGDKKQKTYSEIHCSSSTGTAGD